MCVLSATAAYAGPVRGRVVDPDGRPVPNARVLLVDGGSVVGEVRTDAAGAFEIKAPDAGRYDVRVAVEGFHAEPVTVESTTQADAGTITLDVSALTEAVVVSAALVEIPLSAASSSVTVLTGRELEARQIESVADALRLVPGLAVVSSGGRGSITSVFPRGGESDYSLVFVDGVQANAFGGYFDFAHLPIVNIDRIEVVRGPQSAQYGSNAIGSVIRIVTRRGGLPAASATLEGGSFGTSRFTGATSGGRVGWLWGASAERMTSDGMNGNQTPSGARVENDDYDRHSAAANLEWRRDDGLAIRGDTNYSKNARGFPGPFGSDPGGTYSGIDTVSRGTNDTWLSSFGATVPMGTRVRTTALLTYAHMDGTFESPYSVDPSESLSRRTTARAQADVAIRRGLDLSAGVEFLGERTGSTYITAGGFEIPVKRTVAGTFAEARWSAASRAFVTAGVRVDRIAREAIPADPGGFSPRPALDEDTLVSTNPRVSAAWYVRPDSGSSTKIRGAAGSGIRPPDGFELSSTDNPALKPERSRSVEAGIDQALVGGHGLIEATWFLNHYDDLLVAVGSFRQSSRYRTDNIANARARGLELAGTARGRAASGLDLEARVAWTWLDSEVLAVDQAGSAPPPFTVGDPLIRRARHQVSADVLLSGGPLHAYVHAGARSRALDVDPSYGTFGGLFYGDGFAVCNAGATYRVHKAVDVFARIDNLFDRAYEETLGFPSLGRSAVVGLRVAAGR